MNTYRTFRPAPCHPEARYHALDMCVNCYWKHRRATNPKYRAQVSAGRARRKDKIRADQRAWREKNRDHERARLRAWYHADPTRQTKKRLAYRYGLSLADYEAMVEAREGKCDICGRIPPRPLEVDHDHETGELRGLLCHRCNTGIGLLGDSLENVSRATRYLGQER